MSSPYAARWSRMLAGAAAVARTADGMLLLVAALDSPAGSEFTGQVALAAGVFVGSGTATLDDETSPASATPTG